MNHVQALIKLNESIVGVQKAIQNEDFAAAARYMNWYYEIGDKLPIRDEDKKTMKNAEVELLQIMESKLEESIQKHHTEDVLTYSVLFETYGRGKEGLDRFINYITSEFSSQCKGFVYILFLSYYFFFFFFSFYSSFSSFPFFPSFSSSYLPHSLLSI